MTNEQAKQEAIKNGYGKWYEPLKNMIDKSGKVHRGVVPDEYQNIFGDYYWNNLNGSWWPKSIDGIINNNGWIRIEPDGSNLPDINTDFIWLRKSDGETKDIFHINGHYKSSIKRDYSHYKPITQELKPIY